MTSSQKSVDLSNGIRMPYLEQGNPAGLPALLLHGYTDSCQSWRPLLAALPDHLRVIALTQRGHGDAGRPGAGYRTADFAKDLGLFMDALDLAPALLFGHSMGSQVAQRFAIDQPARVRGLALIGAFTTLRGNPAVLELWDVVSAMRDPVDPAFVREFQRSTLARPVPAEYFEMVVAESLKVPARIWCDALAGMLTHDVAPENERIAAPTLVLWGDRDSLCQRADQVAIVRAIPGARLIVHEGAGHAPHWEEPARIAADLAQFAASLTSIAAASKPARARASRAPSRLAARRRAQ